MKKGCGLCAHYGHACQYHPDPAVEGAKKEARQGSGAARCGRPRSKGRGPCRNEAGKQTVHLGYGPCWLHGGTLPNIVRKAKKDMARDAVRRLGIPRNDLDPQRALLEEIARAAGHVEWLRLKLDEFESDDDLVWGLTGLKISGDDVDVQLEAAKSIWLELYQEERKTLVEVSKAALAAGVAERQVRIAEEKALLIAKAIRGVLKDAGVKETPAIAKSMRKHLLLVSGEVKDITPKEAR